MKDFKFFVENGYVKEQFPDKYVSDSLVKDAIKRFEYAKNSIKRNEEPKFAYENLYECLRELIDSILFLKGFKSFSHEATISYLQILNEFSASEISKIESMRVIRNGMKYYGKSCSVADAKEVFEFSQGLLKKLVQIQRSMKGNLRS